MRKIEVPHMPYTHIYEGRWQEFRTLQAGLLIYTGLLATKGLVELDPREYYTEQSAPSEIGATRSTLELRQHCRGLIREIERNSRLEKPTYSTDLLPYQVSFNGEDGSLPGIIAIASDSVIGSQPASPYLRVAPDELIQLAQDLAPKDTEYLPPGLASWLMRSEPDVNLRLVHDDGLTA